MSVSSQPKDRTSDVLDSMVESVLNLEDPAEEVEEETVADDKAEEETVSEFQSRHEANTMTDHVTFAPPPPEPENPEFAKFKREVHRSNRLIEALKSQIVALKADKQPQSPTDKQQLKILNEKLDSEIEKVKLAVGQCVRRPSWQQLALDQIALPTTLEEDDIPKLIFCPRIKESSVLASSSSLQFEGKLLEENAALKSQQHQIEDEMQTKDQVACCLQRKIKLLHTELIRVVKENERLVKNLQYLESCNSEINDKLRSYKENTEQLEENLNQMSFSLERLQLELCATQKERQQQLGKIK
jgi:hypothetical protein